MTEFRFSDLAGRIVTVVGLSMLVFVFWASRWEAATSWTAKELCVLPRMSLFMIGGIAALLMQGARLPQSFLLFSGAGCLLASYLLLGPVDTQTTDRMMIAASPVILCLKFEFALLAAIACGTWLGRDVRDHMQFVALVLCAVAGDIWLSTFHVPESVTQDHLLSLLRVPFWPQSGRLGLSPAFTDLLFLGAIMESARNLGFHMLSVVMGAFAGYCAGSFLALDPWPAWPALSMLMCASGIMVGCWPEIKCSSRDAGKAFLIGALLLAALIAISTLHRKLHPQPDVPIDQSYYRSYT